MNRPTKLHRYKRVNGVEVEIDDDSDHLRPGEHWRVDLQFCDAMQRSVATTPLSTLDHQPGPASAGEINIEGLGDLRAKAAEAYAAHSAWLENAHKQPPPAAPASRSTAPSAPPKTHDGAPPPDLCDLRQQAQDARRDYIQRVTDAWRTA